jgi:acetyl-CoA synthetase
MAMIHGPFAADDVFWTPVDWMWIGSFIDSVLSPLSYGCTVFTYDRQRFEPVEAVRRLRDFRVTKAFIAPTALRMLMQAGDDEWRGHTLSSVHTGGESLTADAAAWARDVLGFAVDEIYGMTEASFLVGNAHRYYPVVHGSMGLPYPHQTLELRTLDGSTAAVGESGEIVVSPSAPTMFLGYYGRPDATAERFVDGWYSTGDLATCDERGYLHYVGRKDDLIISAGHRLGPGEIEEALRRHEQVRDVAVVGVPDETRGQRVKAFVVPREEATTEQLTPELQDLVRTLVGRHAYPREIEYLDELPRTVTGKVQRHVLREWSARASR